MVTAPLKIQLPFSEIVDTPTATPCWPCQFAVATATMLLPNEDGCGRPATASAAATPPYMSRRTLPICESVYWFAAATPALSWVTLTASVPCTPAARLLIVRSLPTAPTYTVLSALATEFAPNATEFAPLAIAPSPSAVLFLPDALLPLPAAVEPAPLATGAV